MTRDTTNWTPDASCDTPMGLAMRLYQDAWVQALGMQQAWLASLAEWQGQMVGSGWPPLEPWRSWPGWTAATEQLA